MQEPFDDPGPDESKYVDLPEDDSETESDIREYSPEELTDDITLSMVDGVGSLMHKNLQERFGSADAILSASKSSLATVPGIGPVLAERINAARESLNPMGLIKLCRHEDISIISINDSRYPERLRTIHDPPQILYVKGTLQARDAFSIAVIGTRRMSPYGKKMTERLVRQLVHAGFTIISGLALGIDGIAHSTALAENGRTLAVLGGGLKKMYPPEHFELFERIIEKGGAVISEYHPLMSPNRGTFPQRNRIVSGLSLGVLVVEAPEKSGAMITARLANEQGRDVFAVTGPSDSFNSRGCHALIKDGAILTEKVEDIIESLGPMEREIALGETGLSVKNPKELDLNDFERFILKKIDELGPIKPEDLIEKTQLEPGQVLAAIWVLEKREIIQRIGKEKIGRY